MTPTDNVVLNIQEKTNTKTYKLDKLTGRILAFGTSYGITATHEAIIKIVETVRYKYPIYNGSYGTSIESLIGKDFDYVVMELERDLRESLLMDDRVLSVTQFKAKQSSVDTAEFSFLVVTVYGEIVIQKEVFLGGGNNGKLFR